MASEIERTDTGPRSIAEVLAEVTPEQLSTPGQIEALHAKAFPDGKNLHEFRRAALSLLEKASKPS